MVDFFAAQVVLTHNDPGTSRVHMFPVPTKYVAWAGEDGAVEPVQDADFNCFPVFSLCNSQHYERGADIFGKY
jgi:hypothetical protein